MSTRMLPVYCGRCGDTFRYEVEVSEIVLMHRLGQAQTFLPDLHAVAVHLDELTERAQ